MKRSEMVGYVASALCQFFTNVNEDKIKLLADVALGEAEKYGMLPPYSEKMIEGCPCEVNEWEAE